jgi:predicted ribosome quality control (RQC) complex YloA/Tae2 family protein
MKKRRILRFNESKSNKIPFKKIEVDGFVVYYGKSADANDYVTLELSDDEDIWVHAKGVPGSHVLIKVSNQIPDKDVIQKCAEIAVENSKAPSKSEVEVVYCKKRFVFKKEGMNAGQVGVDYKNCNIIKVNKK